MISLFCYLQGRPSSTHGATTLSGPQASLKRRLHPSHSSAPLLHSHIPRITYKSHSSIFEVWTAVTYVCDILFAWTWRASSLRHFQSRHFEYVKQKFVYPALCWAESWLVRHIFPPSHWRFAPVHLILLIPQRKNTLGGGTQYSVFYCL